MDMPELNWRLRELKDKQEEAQARIEEMLISIQRALAKSEETLYRCDHLVHEHIKKYFGRK